MSEPVRGALSATVSLSSSGAAIQDGVDNTIVATVKNYTNSKPITVVAVDSNGDVTSIGGGIQYVEDAAAAANPTGMVPMLVRTDVPFSQVSADGDNIAARANKYGAGFVQVVSSAGALIDTFGGGSQYVEDAAAAADPTGTAVMLVRKDTPSATVSTDGDNIAQRGSNYGAGYVQILTSAGAAVDSFGGSGTQYTEDAAAAADPVGNMHLLVRRDTLTVSEVSADGDNIAAKATSKGELYVKHVDAVPITDNSGSITVDASSWPLPSLAATSTLQTSGNASLSSLDSKFPSLGQAVAAGSIPVVLTAAQLASISGTAPSTGSESNVSDSATSVTVLAANSLRLGAFFYNDSTSVAYVKCSATGAASTTSFTKKLLPQGEWDITLTHYTGLVTAIWVSATGGAMRVTEFTA